MLTKAISELGIYNKNGCDCLVSRPRGHEFPKLTISSNPKAEN